MKERRIILLQRHIFNLAIIQRIISEEIGENPDLKHLEIIYLHDPESIFSILEKDRADVVICGNIFDSELTGPEITEKVKRFNREIIFLVWSAEYMSNWFHDGFIFKSADSFDLIPRIVFSISLETTLAKLREEFPEIQ